MKVGADIIVFVEYRGTYKGGRINKNGMLPLIVLYNEIEAYSLKYEKEENTAVFTE
jgi:hypothetical protein